jgi:hypothetical protein
MTHKPSAWGRWFRKKPDCERLKHKDRVSEFFSSISNFVQDIHSKFSHCCIENFNFLTYFKDAS